jgi:hypothetical protein
VIHRASAVVGLSVLFVASGLRAQEIEESPPAPPPPWVPYCAAAPTAAQVDALEAGGRHKKRIGAIVMAVGGAVVLGGMGLVIAGAWDRHDRCYGHYHDYGYDGRYYSSYYGDCGNTALSIAGATTTVLGIGTLVPGIFIYVSGGADVEDARRLRQRCAGWCW